MTGPLVRRRATAVIAVFTVLMLCACTPHPTTPAPDPPPDTVPGVEESFAAHGIAVIDDVGTGWPVGALLASPSSAVDVMQAEIDSSGGIAGEDLDVLVPMPEGSVPFSFLLAAWLSEPRTPRSETARQWIPGTPDWSTAPTIWFPRAALMFFVADAMEASIADFGSAEPTASVHHTGDIVVATVVAPRQAVPAAPCSSVSAFFSTLLHKIFSAVQLPPDFLATGGALGVISGFLAALYNTAIALAEQALRVVITSLTAPIMEAIGSAVAIVGLVSHLSTYILGVSVSVSTDSVILLDGREGFWTAIVDSNRPLEPQLTDCLATLGQKPMKKIVEPGTEVTWMPSPPKKADGSAFGRATLLYTGVTSTIDDREAAILPWTSVTDIQSTQPPQLGTVGVRAELPKGDVARMLTAARTLVDQAINDLAAQTGPLAPRVSAAVRGILSGALNRLEAEILGAGRSLLMIIGSGTTAFEYREPDPPTAPSGGTADDCYIGSWLFDRLISANWVELSDSGFSHFTLDVRNDRTYTLTVRGRVGTFDVGYDGATTIDAVRGADGTWTVKAPPLTTSYTAGKAADTIIKQGLHPEKLSCGADGQTLTVTGTKEPSYGSAVWRFVRR